MVLADRIDDPARPVEGEVAEAERSGRGDGLWLGAGPSDVEPVDPAVVEVAVDEKAARHVVRAAAVLVHPRAHVGWRTGHVSRRAVGSASYDDHAATVRGPTLEPVQVGIVDAWTGQVDRVGGEGRRGQRRRP